MIHIKEAYNKVEPVGYFLIAFFLFIVVFQTIGMIGHRLMTLGHIVSSTHLRQHFGKKDKYDLKKVIESSGVNIIKDMIQNVQVHFSILIIRVIHMWAKIGSRPLIDTAFSVCR